MAGARAAARDTARVIAALARTRAGAVGLALTGLTVATALLAPALAPANPFAISGPPLDPPSMAHLMGTDALGRDLFSGVVYGARTSLAVALAAGLLAFACGVGVGLLAGYRGGIVDDALMRFSEMFQVLPRFFFVVVALALFGPGHARVVLILGLTSWAVLARVVRTEVVATKNLEFVLASEALGASPRHLLLRVLLPHAMPSALVMLGLIFGQMLLVEASLGFIGLADPGAISWGVLAGEAQGYMRAAWWLPVFPGIAITAAVVGFNLLADALVDAGRSTHAASKEIVGGS